MTPPAGSANVAQGDAHVGVQAHTVHEVTVYQLAANDPPEERYRVGVRHLDGGMPGRARRLIDDAIAAGHTSSEVWFHWLLALLSDRTLRDFTKEDLTRLRSARRQLPLHDDDAWSEGLRMVIRLVDSLKSPDTDLRLLLKELDELAPVQRDKILRHLDLMLKGPLEDQFWRRSIERVTEQGRAGDREKRVWMFFEPEPAAPRVRQPRPVAATSGDRLRAAAATAGLVLASGYLGWLAVQRATLFATLAYLVAIAGGYAGAIHGARWRFRTERLRAKDREYGNARLRGADAAPGGFTHQVEKLFRHYSTKYTPRNADRAVWLIETAGIRRSLRDEIVELYRESRTNAPQLSWLIRYEISDVRRRWQAGTLRAYRYQWRTRLRTRLLAVLGLAALGGGGGGVAVAAVREKPLAGLVATLLVAVCGVLAVRSWLWIVLETWRFAAEQEESQQRLADRRAAFDRWRAKLSRKPSDAEMATWLDCDRKLLMDWAMVHYRLPASSVIAHAFLEAPADDYGKRARVRNGPWRYARYQPLIFFLTLDGVRQVSADLDFENATFQHCHRINYRFDAVAAVKVTDGHPRKFELRLMDGNSIEVRVIESGAERLQEGEDSRTLSEVALDASGLTKTLHVLEGIAAEGKEWVRHELERGEVRISALTSAVHGLLD